MKFRLSNLAFSALLAWGVAASMPAAAQGGYTSLVDPFIGTGNMEGGLSGNCYPGATVPFGMVQLSPDTHAAPDWYNASGYHYNDSTIHGFSHTRLSGTGACDLIDIALFPTQGTATSSSFSHKREAAAPGYYTVDLLDEGIKAELTATPHVGVHRYTFPAGAEKRFWVDVDHSSLKGSWGRQIINAQLRQSSPTRLEGYRIITGWARMRKIYFVAEFDRPVEIVELRDGDRSLRDGTPVLIFVP